MNRIVQIIYAYHKGNQNQASAELAVACNYKIVLEWSWRKVDQSPWC